ncbi:hypothetical protein HMPREF1140_0865 [Lachnoanaerobaculum sp. ICM7]|nr:hypothetical protein HMPREF1140_0865 [Lachnoanaerobaculum sp. ICM7]
MTALNIFYNLRNIISKNIIYDKKTALKSQELLMILRPVKLSV